MRIGYALVALGLLAAPAATAQSRPDSVLYTGRVVNPALVPLSGASVLLKGTVVASSTNAEGTFRFRGPAGPQVMVVSYPRHLTVQQPVSPSDSAVTIVLHSIVPRVTTPPRRRRQQ